MGHGIRTHSATEDQQDGRKDSWLDHGKCDAGHNSPFGGIQNGSCLFQICVHVLENTTDQDISKGCIVKTQNHQTGKHAFTPPQWHFYAKQGCQQSIGCAGNSIGVEKILPNYSQCPLGHDIGENEDGAQIAPESQICPGDQKGENTAIDNGNDTGPNTQFDRIPQRFPEVLFGHLAGKQINIVNDCVSLCFTGKVSINGAGMDCQSVLHNSHNRSYGGYGKNNTHQQQNDIVGLGQKGYEPVVQNRSPTGFYCILIFHETLLSGKTRLRTSYWKDPEALISYFLMRHLTSAPVNSL